MTQSAGSGPLENKTRISEVLGLKFGRSEVKPPSQSFPMLLRPYGGQRLFFGLPTKRLSAEDWDFSTTLFWTRMAVTQLAFWEIEKVGDEFRGYYFSPKKVDTVHYPRELPNTAIWCCKKWRVQYKELPSTLVETLKLIQGRLPLPRKFCAEVSGKDRLFDLHAGWNPVYADMLKQDRDLFVHVGWTFDKSADYGGASTWFDIDCTSPFSIKPTCVEFAYDKDVAEEATAESEWLIRD